MLLKGDVKICAPRQMARDILVHPDQIQKCILGCKSSKPADLHLIK